MFGSASLSLATPASVIWVLLRWRNFRLVSPFSCTSPASVIWVPANGVTQAGQAVVFRFRARADEVRLLRKMTTPIAETASKNGPDSGSGITPIWKSATTGK